MTDSNWQFERARPSYRCVCGFHDYRRNPSCKNCYESKFTEEEPTIEDRLDAIEYFLEGLKPA